MDIFIVGGKTEVYFLAKSFLSQGQQVTIINENEDFCRKLSRSLKVTAIVGDGSKLSVLQEAGVSYADMVIATKENDSDNLVICQIVKKLYGVERTIAVVNDPQNIEIFKQFGVERVISTTYIISSLIEQSAVTEDIKNLMPIADGKVALMQVQISPSSPIVGQLIKDIHMPKNSNVTCILRGDEAIVPHGETEILSQDQLIIICYPKEQAEVLKLVRGRVD